MEPTAATVTRHFPWTVTLAGRQVTFRLMERFREVAKRSAIMKSAHVADIIQLIGTGLGWTPPMLQQPLAALPFLPQPVRIVNMVCTNVPGP